MLKLIEDVAFGSIGVRMAECNDGDAQATTMLKQFPNRACPALCGNVPSGGVGVAAFPKINQPRQSSLADIFL